MNTVDRLAKTTRMVLDADALTGLLERELLGDLLGRLDVFTGEMPGMTCGERGISGKGGGCTRVHR